MSCGGDETENRGVYGYLYQCVEFVRRFYATNTGPNRGNENDSWPRANAADMWDWPTKMGLKRFANGQTVDRPKPDDILVFGPKSAGDVGHVAIVTSVSDSSVTVIEQNWSSTGYATLPMQVLSDGSYFIPNRGSYPITGWMGKRTSVGATVTVSPGDTIEATFTFKYPFAYEPNILLVHFYPDSGSGAYSVMGEVTFYNGSQAISPTTSFGAGGALGVAEQATDSGGYVDFTSIRNRTINGRVRVKVISGSSMLYTPGRTDAHSIQATYCNFSLGTCKASANGELLSISHNGSVIWRP